jgi:hypothetical protein
MNMGFFNKRSYKLTPEQLKASGLEVIQNQTLKTHKLKTHKLKTHKLKSDKLESREITREELIEGILGQITGRDKVVATANDIIRRRVKVAAQQDRRRAGISKMKPPEAAWRKIFRHLDTGDNPKSKAVFRHVRKRSKSPMNPSGKFKYDYTPGAENYGGLVGGKLTNKGKATFVYKKR